MINIYIFTNNVKMYMYVNIYMYNIYYWKINDLIMDHLLVFLV